jgi:hypothetical protein
LACYQRAVRAAPDAPPRGTGTLSFALDEDGRFLPGSAATDGAAEPLRGCAETALREAHFPRPEIGPVNISARLTLDPLP